MRSKFIFAVALWSIVCITKTSAQQTAKITASGIGYLEYLPQDYSQNTNKYPIVVFLHGIGEKGTTSTDPATLLSSVQNVANVGLPKYIKYGTQYPFIMIAPQLKSSYGTWPANYVMEVLNYAKKYLRVDENRIYITGLSLGGFGTWTTLGAYPAVFAAAVPICSGGNSLTRACDIAAANVPLWGFHGTEDKIVSYTVTTKMINAVNACTPKPDPLAKTTLFTGDGHIIWDKVYQQTTAINWMLSFTNGTTSEGGGTVTNSPPVVSAGPDINLMLPANETYVYGSASDADGTISSYRWTKISGGSAGMTNTAGSRLRAYNLLAGTYVFRLTVADDKGATKYDDVTVTVAESSGSNVLPVANAGEDKTTSSTSITVYGYGTDKDGKVLAYKWEKYSGGTVTLTNATSPTVTVSGMVDGKYYLKLTVTDDKGGSHNDSMVITVSGSAGQSVANIAPIAHAGRDKVITTSSIKLYGSGTDKDGRIVSYKWEKYYGPAVTLTNATSSTVTLSGMKDGKYFLRLTVTDDKGATDYDNMNVIVDGSSIAIISNDTRNDEAIARRRLPIYGSSSDDDREIPSSAWIKDFRSDVALTNLNRSGEGLSCVKDGKYIFKMSATDEKDSTEDGTPVVVDWSISGNDSTSGNPAESSATLDRKSGVSAHSSLAA